MFDICISLSPTKTKFGPLPFSGNLDEGLEKVSTMGYQGVELSLSDSDKINKEWLFNKLKTLNLKVYTIATGQTYYNDGYSLFDLNDINRSKTIERLKRHIDLASNLNSMVIIGGIRGKLTEFSEKMEIEKTQGKLALIKCLEYAKERNVILLIEPINRYEANFINTLQEGIELIEELNFSNLKLLPDTYHMNIEERSFEESLIKAKNYIEYIHFADNNRLAPGLGHIDFKKIISLLKEINYKGAIGVEIFAEPDDYTAAKSSIDFLTSLNS